MARQRRSSYSCLFFFVKFFRGWRGPAGDITDESGDEAMSSRRSRLFDEDQNGGLFWMAEPGIDWKASAFINKFHASQHA